MERTTLIAEIVTVEDHIDKTPYGPYAVRARKVEQVVRWNEGQYAGKLELRVAFWENGQRRPGYSDGNPARIRELLDRAA